MSAHVLSLLIVPTTQEVELRSSGSDVRWLSCYETTWSQCSAVFDAFIRQRFVSMCIPVSMLWHVCST